MIPTVVEWFSCASYDAGNSWSCLYTHSDTSYGGAFIPTDWWNPYSEFTTKKDCQLNAEYCDDEFVSRSGLVGTHNKALPLVDFPQAGEDVARPNCAVKATIKNAKQRAYCEGKKKPLNATELALVRARVEAIRAKGGWCAHLATIADSLLGRGDMQFYPRSNFAFGGAAPLMGGASGVYSWMVVDKTFVRKWTDPQHTAPGDWDNPQGLTLQAVIAHELDHLAGSSAIVYPDGRVSQQLTPYTLACSDLP